MADLCSEEEIDPRIKEELERLNSSTDRINTLELQLDEVRATFRQALTESTHSLNAISKKIGSAIEKARPYYEARQRAKDVQLETQRAALRFERACSMLTAAKEMVDLAEQGLFQDGRTFDANWQEMLNHATMKVGEAENERTLSSHEHLSTAATFNEAETEVKRLQKSLRSSINKSRPYFDMKAAFNQNLEKHKRRVSDLEREVTSAKKVYSNALRKLEQISDEIHEQRQASASRLGQRESGVGAEASPVISESLLSPGHKRNLSMEVRKIDQVIKQHRESSSPMQRSKDDMAALSPKVYPLPQRPLSYSESLTCPAQDPHLIMAMYDSTDHLDTMSDTISCQSEPVLDLEDGEEFDSGLDTLPSGTMSSIIFTGTEELNEEEKAGVLASAPVPGSVSEEKVLKERVSVECCSAKEEGNEARGPGPQTAEEPTSATDHSQPDPVSIEPGTDNSRSETAHNQPDVDSINQVTASNNDSARQEGEGSTLVSAHEEPTEQINNVNREEESTRDEQEDEKGEKECIEEEQDGRGEDRQTEGHDAGDAGEEPEVANPADEHCKAGVPQEGEAEGAGGDGEKERGHTKEDTEDQSPEEELFVEEEETFV